MEEVVIDFLYCWIGPLLAILTSALLFISSIVFLKDDFKDRPIFKYISINSACDGFREILSILFPLLSCLKQQNKNQIMSYYLETLSYGVICLSITIKAISEHLSITIAFYRLIELSRFRQINKKLNFKIVIICLVGLSILTTCPVYTWSKIVLSENGTTYKRKENTIFINGINFTQKTILMRRILNFINFILVILPNIKILIVLRNLYKKRRFVLRLTSPVQTRELTSNLFQESNSLLSCTRLLNSTNKEIRVSLLVGSILAVSTIDIIFKSIFQYTTFVSLNYQKLGFFFLLFCYCFLDLLNIISYFCFSLEFRNNFKNFFSS
jgi:hypothetical protein